MEQLNENNDSYLSIKSGGEVKKIIKKRRLENDLNKKPFNTVIYNSFINAIDCEDIDKIRKLCNNINKKNEKDIVYKMYCKVLLTIERFQFIVEKCTKYLNISSNFIKTLFRNKHAILLDIFFSNLKFYDNDFILQFLFYYKYKITISTFDLNQQISNEKFKISISTKYSYNVDKYLVNECCRKDTNFYIIKYLIEYGININKLKNQGNGKTPLFYACEKGNEPVVKYLDEHEADINKEDWDRKSPLFSACKGENEAVIKYLVEHGADINKKEKYGRTPLFDACERGNEAIVKYLLNMVLKYI